MINLKQRIKEGLFFLDGAMGSEIIARGIDTGTCNAYLNIESPEIISDIHLAYLKAGSDAVITNTFGANNFSLARYGLKEQAAEINIAAAQIARKAAGTEKYVLGDIGPSGDFLEPLGTVKPYQLYDIYVEQAQALISGGVDGFIIETMTALDELTITVEAVKSVAADLPVFASMSFDRAGDDFKTMMGIDVDTAIVKMISLGIDAVGYNCGSLTLDEYINLSRKFVMVTKSLSDDTEIYAEPNAGKPKLLDNKAVYTVSPEEFAVAAQKIHSIGINIIGGCCGTSPKHIEAMTMLLK
jgi:5-methyltetrahydrofolate--homocysteine methyltransferase